MAKKLPSEIDIVGRSPNDLLADLPLQKSDAPTVRHQPKVDLPAARFRSLEDPRGELIWMP